MHWIYLITAIIMEVAGTTSMKLSDGFSKPLPSLSIFIFYGLSLAFLTLALKSLPVGMTYAIWAAVGTALITLVGVLCFGESMNLLKIISLLLIIIGVAGLHASRESML
ncbi:MAG: multidrug efflux SMR transporter [Chlorobiales bacterium]|nr:multidrug efflux SMR transporter [Chlorobiales bacterium]